MKHVLKLIAVLALVAVPAHGNYLDNLKRLQGRSYGEMNCFTFISIAHGGGGVKTSTQMWHAEGMQLVGEYSDAVILSVDEDNLKPGDVAVFLAGGHVAAYLGNHLWTDSTHRGVTTFHLLDRAISDYWYQGHVRGSNAKGIRVVRYIK